jgi:anti-sigma factor RsiW
MRHISEAALEELAMGRLSRYRSERLEAHMAFCRRCQERFAIEREIRSMVREAGRRLGVAQARPRRRALR